MKKTFWFIIAIWAMFFYALRGFILICIPIALVAIFNENCWWLLLEIVCFPIGLKWFDTIRDNDFKSKFSKLYSYL